MPNLYECKRCKKIRYPKAFRGHTDPKEICQCKRNASGRLPPRDLKKRRRIMGITWRPGTPAAVKRAAEKTT